MTDPIQKATADAVEAADNTELTRQIAAILAAQQAAHQPPAPAPCQHQHDRRPGRSTGDWIGIACAVCIGSVGIAFASLAIAIAACCATGCFLILRGLWNDMRKGR